MLDHAGPGVVLRQPSVDAASATVEVTTSTRNDGPRPRRVDLHTVVVDANDRVVASDTTPTLDLPATDPPTVTRRLTIATPHRWQGRTDPYLYRTTVQVRDATSGAVLDSITQPLGLRTVSIDADHGLRLNGTHLPVHGISRHADRPGRGWATTTADAAADFDLMDEMGVNAIRTAHYQQDQAIYDLADRRGYLVWTEIPLVNAVTPGPAFQANARQQLLELIRQNVNHPSVVFWGIGNEQAVDDPTTNDLLADLAATVAREDPDRCSAYASEQPITSHLTGHTDVVGYNRYHGWYYGTASGLGPFLDQAHHAAPDRPMLVSEYGAGASVVQHALDPGRPEPTSRWHPEEYQALLHEQCWTQIAARGYLVGSFVWNMFDFASDRRSEGDTPGRNDKGLVTYDRTVRKDAFYWYKANWTPTRFVHLTSSRFTDRATARTPVKVYATADTVSLTVNGQPVGPPISSSNHIYRWPAVTLAPGANTIEVTGVTGTETTTDTATWYLRA